MTRPKAPDDLGLIVDLVRLSILANGLTDKVELIGDRKLKFTDKRRKTWYLTVFEEPS